MDTIDRYELPCGPSYAVARTWGCNLFSWVVDGAELIYCPDNLPAEATKITGGGNPILFPSVGRTWDQSSSPPVAGRYRVHGSDREYLMPSHGVVYLSRFTKLDETRSSDEITATYELSVPEKVREENYPFDVALRQRFVFRPTSVELEAAYTNKGDGPAPVAFGYHPYFRVSNPEREGVEVHVPAIRHLLVTKDTVLPTGESEPTDGVLKLKAGIYYDDAFSGLTGKRMSLVDRRAGHTISVDYDEKAELLVVYAPDNSDFVCIEPWTGGLGAFEDLKKPDWQNGTYIPVLKPGESRMFKAAFSVHRP